MPVERIGGIARTVALLVGGAMACPAGVMYNVAIDTSSLSGNSGGIYMQFNGGLNADQASVAIGTFTIGGGGLQGTPLTSGGVTGSLDGLPLVMENSGGLNDYLHLLTYGSDIFFTVEFLLPAPLVGDSGSTFSFGLTESDGLTPVLTADPAGWMGQIGYDQTGAFTVANLGYEGIATISVAESAIPEPGTGWLLAGAAALGLGLRRRRPGKVA